MALARVVTFDGVTKDRVEKLTAEMREGGPPPDFPATEVIMLHDPAADRSVVVIFFENDEDYRKGDEILNAMPAGDTPGQRTSVIRYDVPFRMTA